MKLTAYHARFLAVALGFVLLPFALVAAITDADLAKVTQMIQEGKTARAKAEITILLDENPNDANAPKLRKLLASLDGGSAARDGTTPANQSAATMKDTVDWIARNASMLVLPDVMAHEDDIYQLPRPIDRIIEKRGSELIYTRIMRPDPEYSRLGDRNINKEARWSMCEISVDLSKLSSARTNNHHLVLTCAEPAIRIRWWHLSYYNDYLPGWRANGSNERGIALPVSHATLMSGDRLSVQDTDAWKKSAWQTEKRELRVEFRFRKGYEDFGSRIRNAFEHLIKLSGGGGKEPF